MKRLAFLGLCFVVSQCGKRVDNKIDLDPIDPLKEKGAFYFSQMDDSIYTRCDKLAFKPYVTVAGYTQDLSGFEENGKWNRDVITNPPCYPNESKGTISFDGIISVLHHIWTVKDVGMLNRMWEYGEAKDWIIGEGEFANQKLIRPIVSKMRRKMSSNVGMSEGNLDSVLSGFRGHLLASYLWLEGRMDGSLSPIEKVALKALLQANKEDPMYISLHSRFIKGSQDKAIEILLNHPNFPSTFPRTTGIYNWGSAPTSVYYLFTLAIIEGK